MKKTIFLSLIAAFTMTLTANAQSEETNTYNMVITMANGNSITIGPNEIQDIAFNDGAVVVTGQKIDEMVNQILQNEKMIQLNSDQIQLNKEQIDANKARIENVEGIYAQKEFVYAILANYMTRNESAMTIDQSFNDRNNYESTGLYKELLERTHMLQAQINVLQAQIDALQNKQ
jgi:hypothetical protein